MRWRESTLRLHVSEGLADEIVVALAVNGQVDVEDAAGSGARLDDAARDALVVLEFGDILRSDDSLAEQGAPSLGDPSLEKHKDRGLGLAAVQDFLDERLLLVLEEGSLGELRGETLDENLSSRPQCISHWRTPHCQ